MQPARELHPLGELEAFKCEEISTTTFPHFSLYSTKIFRICVAQAGLCLNPPASASWVLNKRSVSLLQTSCDSFLDGYMNED